mgnify:CR=1 FL=1
MSGVAEVPLSVGVEPAIPDGLNGKSGGRALRDQLARVVVWGAFLLACVPLVWILASTILKGGHMLLDPQWWTNSQNGITARRVGGGAAHAIQGTLMQAVVTAAAAAAAEAGVTVAAAAGGIAIGEILEDAALTAIIFGL